MSTRILTHRSTLNPPRASIPCLKLAKPTRTPFLQSTSQFSRASLKTTPKRSLRSHSYAEYTNSHDEGGHALGLGLIQDATLSSRNGYSRPSDVVNGFTGEVHVDEDEYYVPAVGHRVLGVVVSGSHLKLDVDIGASKLAHLHIQNLLPLDRISISHSKWILRDDACEEGASSGVPATGRPQILYDVDVFEGAASELLVEVGTVVEVEVIGESVGGVALLSARKAASRIAWDRVVQIRDEKEPLEVVITELNSSGLIARVEGLRAFLPHSELLKKPDTSNGESHDASKGESHDAYLGRTLLVTVLFAREIRGNIIISEKDAWIKQNLQPWSLHNGTVIRLFPYGALVHVRDTDIWGMIHISNIANARIAQVSDVFEVGEQVKMLLVESPVPERYSFSTALLESEPGLMLQDKQRVFREAEERAAELRKTFAESKPPTVKEEEDEDSKGKPLPWKVTKPISNWEWLDFIEEEASLS